MLIHSCLRRVDADTILPILAGYYISDTFALVPIPSTATSDAWGIVANDSPTWGSRWWELHAFCCGARHMLTELKGVSQ